jgi:hypothetical protein
LIKWKQYELYPKAQQADEKNLDRDFRPGSSGYGGFYRRSSSNVIKK